jgi:hypothetical protein
MVSVKSIVASLRTEYAKTATTQNKVIDLFLVYVLLTALVQVRAAPLPSVPMH